MVTSESCLPDGDGCLFCLHILLVGSLLVLIVIILILACWILPKYRASKFCKSFTVVFHGLWTQTGGERVRMKRTGNQK